jgi:exodeoxyribonuclease V gamma subunit
MLHIHRCASARVLADALAGMLATSTGNVFAAEVVAVPAKGIERWLAQRLSHVLGAGSAGSGVCANVHFPNPDALLDSALTADTTGTRRQMDPWDPQRAVWPLLEVIDSTGGRLGVRSAARSYQVATRLAEIFARYGQERPVMVQRWAAGADTGDDGAPLPEDLRWQPELWRGLRAAIGVPSPAETLPEALERLLVAPELVKLPERFSVFGLTRLAAARTAVLTTLARHREVHLWINHPSPVLWDAVAAGGGAGHPLSASMAREVICLQRRLAAATPGAVERVHPSPARPATLLGRLQETLAADRVADRTDRPALAPGDDSVVLHSCHGRARQVEVLREAILERLAADPTLQPRDVLVICPDIEEFAPLVAAAFTGPNPGADPAGSAGPNAEGGRGTHPVVRLRVSMADRSPRANNPLLDTAASVLKCWTWPAPKWCAAGSDSSPRTSRGCASGSVRPGSVGGSTPRTGRAGGSAASQPGRGVTGSTACCSGQP